MKKTTKQYIYGMFVQLIIVGFSLLFYKTITFFSLLGMLLGLIIFFIAAYFIEKKATADNKG